MQSETFSYEKAAQKLYHSLFSHIRVLFYDLDCVKDQSVYGFTKSELIYEASKDTKNSTKSDHQPNFNFTYFFPFLLSLTIATDSLVLWAANDFHYEPTAMEGLFSHLIFPRKVWPQADIMMGLAVAMAVTIFPLLFADRMLDRKFAMYLFTDHRSGDPEIVTGGGGGGNGRTLPPDETRKIVAYRRRMRSLMSLLMASLMGTAEAFTLWNLYTHWSSVTSTAQLYLMAVCIALFFCYGCFSNLFLLYYFVLATRYIRIKQSCRQLRLTRLADIIRKKVVSSPFTNNSRKSLQNSSVWRAFQRLNGQFLLIFEEIWAQNRFWCKYLTVYFLVYIIDIVYLWYSFFFLDTSALGILQVFFPFFAIEFTLLLVIVTLECSGIVAKNCQTHRDSQRVLLQLQLVYPLTVFDLLKIDSMAVNYKNIPQICFKLLNNYQINSNMFQMVLNSSEYSYDLLIISIFQLFSYTSLLFLMVVQKG